jgi:dihydroorotase
MYPQGKYCSKCLANPATNHIAGGTTNSDNGVADLEAYYATFGAMEKNDMGKLQLICRETPLLMYL